MLQELNVSRNLISSPDELVSQLQVLTRFRKLSLTENMLSKQQETDLVSCCRKFNFDVIIQDDVIVTSSEKLVNAVRRLLVLPGALNDHDSVEKPCKDFYLNMVTTQLESYFDLVRTEIKETKNFRGWKLSNQTPLKPVSAPPDIYSSHSDYLKKHFDLAVKHRLVN